MANIANFEVDGVSYSYDTESRNPLSNKVEVKAFEGELVYDANTKAPTEVVGIPANSLKASAEASKEPSEPSEPSEPVDNRQERTLSFYAEWSCINFPVTIVYKGSLNNTDGKPLIKGIVDGSDSYHGYDYNNETFTTSTFEVDGSMHHGPYGDEDAALRDDSEDWGFEIVSIDQTPHNYQDTTVTVKVTDVAF